MGKGTGKFNIENTKNVVSDIKGNIDTKKKELSDLEKVKEELLEAGTEIQGANIGEKAVEVAMDGINRELEANAEKGKELSDEMKGDLDMLEEKKQETQDAISENADLKTKLEKKQQLLDKIGMGANLDSEISELDDNAMNLDSLNQSLIDAQKELTNVSYKLGSL